MLNVTDMMRRSWCASGGLF